MSRPLYVAWLSPGTVSTFFSESLVGLVWDPRTRRLLEGYLSYVSTPHLALTRTLIARTFLASRARWLLMVDADIVFDFEQVLVLYEAARRRRFPILAGSYFGYEPTTGNAVQEAQGSLGPPDADGVEEVQVAGTGFMLVHRRVFERQEQKQPGPLLFEEMVINGQPVGEDWGWCQRVRELGFPVRVHTGVTVGHAKTVVVGPGGSLMFRRPWVQPQASFRQNVVIG